uniref:Uncharacterized protein n=1 Tax=Anguilla anguilla TaxID=7936 RepID=A0A0E9W787_ANGAN
MWCEISVSSSQKMFNLYVHLDKRVTLWTMQAKQVHIIIGRKFPFTVKTSIFTYP